MVQIKSRGQCVVFFNGTKRLVKYSEIVAFPVWFISVILAVFLIQKLACCSRQFLDESTLPANSS